MTAPVYRLFSIDDNHPGMVKVAEGGAAVAVEVSPPLPTLNNDANDEKSEACRISILMSYFYALVS